MKSSTKSLIILYLFAISIAFLYFIVVNSNTKSDKIILIDPTKK